jgi:hypothetical protein
MLLKFRFPFCGIVVTNLIFAFSAGAASVTVTVPGTADLWLAGQPSGGSVTGTFGTDTVLAEAAVLASTGLNLTAGSYLTVTASGGTNYNGCADTTPDAGACGLFSTGPAFGLSTFNGPPNALIGVFINGNVPSNSNTSPVGLDFTTVAAQSAAVIAPQLNQVFFIGDGLTGTGSGAVQHFIIPAGATRLFLGSADSVGANYNNTGSFTVTVTDSAGASTAIPAPAASPLVLAITAVLLVVGAASLLGLRRARSAA